VNHQLQWPMDRWKDRWIDKRGLEVMVFNATFNNILVISWRSVLFVEETSVPGENYRPASSHWQMLSQNVVSIDKREFLYQSSWFTKGPKSNAFKYFFGSLKIHWNYLDLQSKFLQMLLQSRIKTSSLTLLYTPNF